MVGLSLFLLVSIKVFFVDLGSLEQLYRIVAFVVLGVITISGSFLYLKYRHKFTVECTGPEPEESQT